jgi:hypothetical protein
MDSISLLQLAIPDKITNLSLAHHSGAGHLSLWLKRLIHPMVENLKDILNITGKSRSGDTGCHTLLIDRRVSGCELPVAPT